MPSYDLVREHMNRSQAEETERIKAQVDLREERKALDGEWKERVQSVLYPPGPNDERQGLFDNIIREPRMVRPLSACLVDEVEKARDALRAELAKWHMEDQYDAYAERLVLYASMPMLVFEMPGFDSANPPWIGGQVQSRFAAHRVNVMVSILASDEASPEKLLADLRRASKEWHEKHPPEDAAAIAERTKQKLIENRHRERVYQWADRDRLVRTLVRLSRGHQQRDLLLELAAAFEREKDLEGVLPGDDLDLVDLKTTTAPPASKKRSV